MRTTIALLLCIITLTAATYTVTQTDKDTAQIVVTDSDASACNFELKGAMIKAIDCDAPEKVAVAWRNKGIVYGLNSDVLPEGTVIDLDLRVYGNNTPSVASVISATPSATLTTSTVNIGTLIQSNNTRSTTSGAGQTIIGQRSP